MITFQKIKNDIYHLIKENINKFGYIFKSGEDKLSYKKVNFLVQTLSESAKFCYTSNLGGYIEPALQNCYHVGKTNSFTLKMLNPYIMPKNYYTSENTLDYYISFSTEDYKQNITIIPTLDNYTTNNRKLFCKK